RLPFASGLDSPGGLAVAGPIARTVADAALLLDVQVAGRAYSYATRAPGEGPYLNVATGAARFARIGVTTVSPWDDDEDIVLDPEAARAVEVAMALLADAGNGVETFDWRP